MATHLTGIVRRLSLTAGSSQATQAEPLRIGYVIWVGLRAAVRRAGERLLRRGRRRGRADQHGASRRHVRGAARRADRRDRRHGRRHAADFDPKHPYACVLATDESRGGDGIVANKDIQAIADLKGKTVAFPSAPSRSSILNVLLKEAGLSEADIEHRGADRRGCRQRLSDAGGRRCGDLGTVADSRQAGRARPSPRRLSETPGLIVDCLVAKTMC